MIVAMKKISVIVEEKDAQAALGEMRSLGALHVEHQTMPAGKDISQLQDELALVNQAIGILSETEFSSKGTEVVLKLEDWKLSARHLVDLRKRYEQLKEYSLAIKKAISQWQEWGDFDPEEIRQLNGKNIYVRLYQIPVKEIKELSAEVTVKKVSVKAGLANCVVISRQKAEMPYKELSLPKMSLPRMRARLIEDTRVMEDIRNEIAKHAVYIESFIATRKSLEKELELQQARRGMGQAGSLVYLTGYAPRDAVGGILINAKKEKWGILVNEPSVEDAVPTLLSNPRWIAVVEPVFKLLEIIPGYRELDISPPFLFFLSLFFGMIIGDAGYGAIYFLLTFWAHKKLAKKIKDTKVFFLFYIFSACAIFWGLVTGTVFGQEWYLRAGMKPLIPVLNDTKFLQTFCFFLGAFHLTLGHGWQAIRKMPSLVAFSDVGWICVLWAAFFLAKTLILNDPFPALGKWLIILGLSLVVFCTSPQRNILKMIGEGLGAMALSLVNNFTDVVSYVRLFAVGLAGIAISDTVNALAAGFGGSAPWASMLIIFLGHTINIVLGPLSVLVHGIRLNVLEFSGHVGLSWSGVAYKPLKE